MAQYYVIDRGYYRKSWKTKLLAGGLLGLAVGIGVWAYAPIIMYQGFVAPEIGNRTYVSPLPASAMVLGARSENNLDNPTTWFTGVIENTQVILPEKSEYSITIPALKIKEAKVVANGQDLSKSLIQYPGTAVPGGNGSAVIFGHSVLPQFFNPKNYKTIFSTLHTIKKGESIIVKYDGVLYHYQVMDKYEVNPNDMYVLEQNLGSKTLKLITCTPPGTYAKRLVVESQLVPYEGLEELYEKNMVSSP